MSIINIKRWLLAFCLLMSFREILSQDCNDLRHELNGANKANLELLNVKMGSTIPLQCVDDVINFSSKPNEESLPSIYDFEEENATVAIDEILQQISYLFNQNHTKLSWDENSIATFKLGVDNEIKKLTPCLSDSIDELRDKVRKYFERINNLLKEKEYNLCAWEIVQMEVRDHSSTIVPKLLRISFWSTLDSVWLFGILIQKIALDRPHQL
uniref:Uncharacterized protein n=1 Tax=Anolis carolinensis TaxID=28377 RepID=A0A803SSW1_ANOCA